MKGYKKQLLEGLSRLEIEVSGRQLQQLVQHAEALMIWNQKMNLTAIKDPLAIAEKHFIDSAAASLFLKNEKTLLDLGSGAGFPGIPLKILQPDLRILLLDASRKKVSFLKHVIRTSGLSDIDAVHTRIEDFPHNALFQKKADGIISRAFTNLSDIITLSKPLLRSNGIIYAMKGRQIEKELQFDGSVDHEIQLHHYHLPFENSERCMIEVKIL